MQWRETGGPPVGAPERRGFGTVVVGDMVRLGLGGTVTKDFRPEGFVWTVKAPLTNVSYEGETSGGIAGGSTSLPS